MRFAIKLILAVLWTAFIVYALLSEPSAVPKYPWLKFPGVDKLIHAILFVAESFLLVWSFSDHRIRVTALLSVFWCFILGGGLELAQHYYVEGRSGDLLDLGADLLGAVIGVILVAKWMKK